MIQSDKVTKDARFEAESAGGDEQLTCSPFHARVWIPSVVGLLCLVVVIVATVLQARDDVEALNMVILKSSKRAVGTLSRRFEDRFEQAELLSFVWSGRVPHNTSQAPVPLVDPIMNSVGTYLKHIGSATATVFVEYVENNTEAVESFKKRMVSAYGMEEGYLSEFAPDGSLRRIGPDSPPRKWFALLCATSSFGYRVTKGLDLASNPLRRQLLEVSRAENRLSVTAPITLQTSASDGTLQPTPGFVTYSPVFAMGPEFASLTSPEYNESTWKGEEDPEVLHLRQVAPMPGQPVNETLFTFRGWTNYVYTSRHVAVLDAADTHSDDKGLLLAVWDAREDKDLQEVVEKVEDGEVVEHGLDKEDTGAFLFGASVNAEDSKERKEGESMELYGRPRYRRDGVLWRLSCAVRLRDSIWSVTVAPTDAFIATNIKNTYITVLIAGVLTSFLILVITIVASEYFHGRVAAERQRAAIEKEHTDRTRLAIQSIITYATHELRNPLQVVLGEIALMRSERRRGRPKRKVSEASEASEMSEASEAEEEVVQRVEEAAMTMKRVVDQMTHVAKMREAGSHSMLEATSLRLTTRNSVLDASLPRDFLVHTVVEPSVPQVCVMDRSKVARLVTSLAELAGEHASGNTARLRVHVQSQSIHTIRTQSSYLRSSSLSHATLSTSSRQSRFPGFRSSKIHPPVSGRLDGSRHLQAQIFDEAHSIRLSSTPHYTPFGIVEYLYPHVSEKEGLLWKWEEKESMTGGVVKGDSMHNLVEELGNQQLEALKETGTAVDDDRWNEDPRVPVVCFDLTFNAPTLEPGALFDTLASLGVVSSSKKSSHNPWRYVPVSMKTTTSSLDVEDKSGSRGMMPRESTFSSASSSPGYSSVLQGMVLSVSALWQVTHSLRGYFAIIDRRSDGGLLILRAAIPLIPPSSSLAAASSASLPPTLVQALRDQNSGELHPHSSSTKPSVFAEVLRATSYEKASTHSVDDVDDDDDDDDVTSAVSCGSSTLPPPTSPTQPSTAAPPAHSTAPSLPTTTMTPPPPPPPSSEFVSEEAGDAGRSGDGGSEEEHGAGALVGPASHSIASSSLSTPSQRKRRRGRKSGGGKLEGVHVLVVDDEESLRLLLSRMLNRLGATCETLEDGDLVESTLRARGMLPSTVGVDMSTGGGGEMGKGDAVLKKFDVILMDIAMARSDGARVTQRLVHSLGVRVPILAVTANHQEWDVTRFKEAGFVQVLGKPIHVSSLRKALVEALKQSQDKGPSSVSTNGLVTGKSDVGVKVKQEEEEEEKEEEEDVKEKVVVVREKKSQRASATPITSPTPLLHTLPTVSEKEESSSEKMVTFDSPTIHTPHPSTARDAVSEINGDAPSHGQHIESVRQVLIVVICVKVFVEVVWKQFTASITAGSTIPSVMMAGQLRITLSSLHALLSLLTIGFIVASRLYPQPSLPPTAISNLLQSIAPPQFSPFAPSWLIHVAAITGVIGTFIGCADVSVMFGVCSELRSSGTREELLVEAVEKGEGGTVRWDREGHELGHSFANYCIGDSDEMVPQSLASLLGYAFFAPVVVLLLTPGFVPWVAMLFLMMVVMPILVVVVADAVATEAYILLVMMLVILPFTAIVFYVTSSSSTITNSTIVEERAKVRSEMLSKRGKVSTLVAGQLAHDISHAMHCAMDSTETIREHLQDAREHSTEKRALRGLSASLYLASRLLADSVDTVALSEGKLRLQEAPGSLVETVKAMQAVGDGIGDADVEVEVRGDHLDSVVFDPVRIEQLLLNGLSNATKYAPPRSKIRILVNEYPTVKSLISAVRDSEALPRTALLFTVSAHPLLSCSTPTSAIFDQGLHSPIISSPSMVDVQKMDEDSIVWVRIRIQDEGPGLRGESATRLFKEFEQSMLQATAETSTGAGGRSLDRMRGRGLGLSMVARVILLMGGAVALRDRADGESGCVFDVALPLVVALRSRGPRRPRKQRHALSPLPQLHDKVCLVADDQPLIRRMMTKTLRQLGAREVLVGSSGEELVEHVKKSVVDVAATFVDQDMGGGWDGMETASELRKNGIAGPIVIVSGNEVLVEEECVKSAGVTHALKKPFVARDVEALIRGFSEGSGGE